MSINIIYKHIKNIQESNYHIIPKLFKNIQIV